VLFCFNKLLEMEQQMTYQPYPIRFRPEERKMLRELAERYDRSQQSIVRMLVRSTYENLQERERSVKETQQNKLTV
jgi:hypothetical protein